MSKSRLLLTGRALVAVALVLIAGTALGQNVEKKDSVSTIPAEVAAILKPACMTCHSNEGRDKPKSKVNFSVWDQYSPMEKKLIASSITDEVKKGSMPPKRFLESHPESALTEAQINQIVLWCDALKAKP